MSQAFNTDTDLALAREVDAVADVTAFQVVGEVWREVVVLVGGRLPSVDFVDLESNTGGAVLVPGMISFGKSS